jgi:hypothetical protein
MGGDFTVNSIPTDGHLTKFFARVRAISHSTYDFSTKPVIEKTESPETFIFYFRIRFCLF